eukprot:6521029-Prymnesium_polylepis.1
MNGRLRLVNHARLRAQTRFVWSQPPRQIRDRMKMWTDPSGARTRRQAWWSQPAKACVTRSHTRSANLSCRNMSRQ